MKLPCEGWYNTGFVVEYSGSVEVDDRVTIANHQSFRLRSRRSTHSENRRLDDVLVQTELSVANSLAKVSSCQECSSAQVQ